jgi:arylsulfate sulfotransferase
MRKLLGLLIFTGVSLSAADPPFVIHLETALPSPQPVGTPIGLMPQTRGTPEKGMLVYQYSVSVNGGPFRIVRDFSQQSLFAWTPELFEQMATIRMKVRNNQTKAIRQEDLPFRITSRVIGTAPTVTPTANPLVALFSAPPCPAGSTFRVAFHAAGEEMSRTPPQPCKPSLSNNVYVAGMRAETKYHMREELSSGGFVKASDWLPFQTGMLDGIFPPVSIVVPRITLPPASESVIVYSAASRGMRPFATDQQGRLIWFSRTPDFLTRMIPGGHFLLLADGQNSVNAATEKQLLREMDLAGNIVRETNVGRVAEQLDSLGIHSNCGKDGKECVSGFHHEAIRLPNGHTMVVAGMERIMPAGTQGSKEPVDVLGDLVIDLDQDFQATGVWNSFDHLDVERKGLEGVKCRTGGGGCPAVLLMPEANGWLHTNALNYIPSTGDFLMSMLEQDWVIKVDWKNGKGSGKVLWRLGNEGDFKVESSDPHPWFSHQHDAGFEPVNSNILTLVDNTGGLKSKNDLAGVRGQVWVLDEDQRIARLVYTADTGQRTSCCGSMQTLKDGGYNVLAGSIPPLRGRTAEANKDGKIIFAIEVEGSTIYRTYRVDDMYSAPTK